MAARLARTIVSFATGVLLACAAIAYARFPLSRHPSPDFQRDVQPALGTYLGFDRNDYPGDTVLDALAQDFAFCGYWLNAPPGEKSDTWLGKREILRSHGFGFLVLFNGRLDKELKSARDPKTLGSNDATAAVDSAKKEGFPPGTIIFLDQEEGGRMLPEQQAYLYAWIDAVNFSGYKAGV
ncbi:MAG TPA: glycoside hydrolase domain-containing protein, partial [Candidatus Acidoferrales bacterium]|nr:glycoside hydrolase domain-containing protein [Candidatus Acidoferrales bacterium]